MGWTLNFTSLFDRFAQSIGSSLQSTSAPPEISSTIVPVFNAVSFGRTQSCISNTYNISAAAATMGTVPAGKQWRIIASFKGATAGATGIFFNGSGAVGGVWLTPFQLATDWKFYGSDGIVVRAGVNSTSTIVLGQGAGGDAAIAAGLIYYEESLTN